MYTLWSGLGTLGSELFTLGSCCYRILEWGRYESWGVGFCEPFMVVWRGTECTRLRWVCGCLVLGWCSFRECLCCKVEKLMFLVLVCDVPDSFSLGPTILWLTRLGIFLPLWLHPLVFQWVHDYVVGNVFTGLIHGSHLWLVPVILGTCSGPKRCLFTMPLILCPPMNFGFPGYWR